MGVSCAERCMVHHVPHGSCCDYTGCNSLPASLWLQARTPTSASTRQVPQLRKLSVRCSAWITYF